MGSRVHIKKHYFHCLVSFRIIILVSSEICSRQFFRVIIVVVSCLGHLKFYLVLKTTCIVSPESRENHVLAATMEIID